MVGELQRLCTWELFTVAQLGRRVFVCSLIHFCTVEFLTVSIALYEGLKKYFFFPGKWRKQVPHSTRLLG